MDNMSIVAVLFLACIAIVIFLIAKGSGEKREAERRQATRERQIAQERQEALNKEHGGVLLGLRKGKLPQVAIEGRLPFKFMKSEHLVYVFQDVGYLEQRTKREIVGRSVGTSIRVAKGVSFRVGGSRGTPVERDVITDRGVGLMAITTKHLYFNGDRSFRIAHGKIVSVEQMEDAVSVTRDRASAHPEFFVVGRPFARFAYDLLQAIPSFELGHSMEDQDYTPLSYYGIEGADYVVEDGESQ